MKNANIRKRIKYFVDSQDITQKDFFKKSNLNRGLLDTDKLEKDVGADKITNILVAFPELNIEWLMLGKGEMLKTKSTENVVKKDDHKNDHKNDLEPKVQKMWSNKEYTHSEENTVVNEPAPHYAATIATLQKENAYLKDKVALLQDKVALLEENKAYIEEKYKRLKKKSPNTPTFKDIPPIPSEQDSKSVETPLIPKEQQSPHKNV